jgi:DNA-binding response OmpR family regulator
MEVIMEPLPRVLIVEDDNELRNVLCEQLERADYRVVAVADGLVAARELEDGPWAVLLTDFRVPRLNGLDLLGLVSACWSDTSVVLLSAEGGDTAKLALKRGAFAWITKPYELDHLLRTVKAAAERTSELRDQRAASK